MTKAITAARPLEGLQNKVRQLKLRAAALWRDHPRETVAAGLITMAGAMALAGVANSTPETAHTAPSALAAPPAPPQMILRQIAPQQAIQVNQQIPLADSPNPAAKPFIFRGNGTSRQQALECLASAEYYEAGDQGDDGERAVAQVVLNRVRHPAFPGSVCAVVYEGSTKPTSCQFTFTCDGSLYRQPDAEGWKRAYKIAGAALSGSVYAPVGYATHYHANYVLPYWSSASTLLKNAVVGAHIFYRWSGGWGQPAAFAKIYAGREPDARSLRNSAIAAAALNAASRPSGVAEALKEIPGAVPLKLAPSMRGDKRVAVRFNLTARAASDTAIHEDYSKQFKASDNLKWALSGDTVAQNEKPLGEGAKGTSLPATTDTTSAPR